MKANPFSLNSVLGERQQWVVPVYQRHYEWETSEDKQLPKLWEDLREETLERLERRTPLPHYFGAILYSEPQSQTFGTVPFRFLVDGQQRITTFQLVLAALKEVARANNVGRLAASFQSATSAMPLLRARREAPNFFRLSTQAPPQSPPSAPQ